MFKDGMTPKKADGYFRSSIRAMGGYAALSIILLFFWIATVPNGTDHGWHLILGGLIALMWAFPFVAMLFVWIGTEIIDWKGYTFSRSDDGDNSL